MAGLDAFRQQQGTVTVDGDTTRDAQTNEYRRLAGAQAPETAKPNGQQDAPGARAAMSALDRFRQQPDAEWQPTGDEDRYGRELGDYEAGGETSSQHLIRKGLASPFDMDAPGATDAFLQNRAVVAGQAPADNPTERERIAEQWATATPGGLNIAREPTKRGLGSMFSDAVERGVDQLQMLGGGVTKLAGDATGIDMLSNAGDRIARENMGEVALNRKESEGFTDIDGVGSAVDWVVETLGEQAPNLATMLIPGGVAAQGGRLATQRALVSGAEAALGVTVKNVAKRLADDAAGPIMRETLEREFGKAVMARAGMAGAAVGSYGMAVGENKLELDTQAAELGIDTNNGLGALTALPQAALDVIGLKALTPLARAAGISQTSLITAWRQAPAELAKVVLTEGGTEATQAWLLEGAKQIQGGAQAGAIDWHGILEEGAAGALIGGTVRGATIPAEVALAPEQTSPTATLPTEQGTPAVGTNSETDATDIGMPEFTTQNNAAPAGADPQAAPVNEKLAATREALSQGIVTQSEAAAARANATPMSTGPYTVNTHAPSLGIEPGRRMIQNPNVAPEKAHQLTWVRLSNMPEVVNTVGKANAKQAVDTYLKQIGPERAAQFANSDDLTLFADFHAWLGRGGGGLGFIRAQGADADNKWAGVQNNQPDSFEGDELDFETEVNPNELAAVDADPDAPAQLRTPGTVPMAGFDANSVAGEKDFTGAGFVAEPTAIDEQNAQDAALNNDARNRLVAGPHFLTDVQAKQRIDAHGAKALTTMSPAKLDALLAKPVPKRKATKAQLEEVTIDEDTGEITGVSDEVTLGDPELVAAAADLKRSTAQAIKAPVAAELNKERKKGARADRKRLRELSRLLGGGSETLDENSEELAVEDDNVTAERGDATAAEVLRLAAKSLPPHMRVLARAIAPYIEKVAVRVDTDGTNQVEAGWYDVGLGEIVINPRVPLTTDERARLVLHEAVHAATADLLRNRPAFRNAMLRYRDQLATAVDKWEAAGKTIPAGLKYALQGEADKFADEFLAQAFSNRDTMRALAALKGSGDTTKRTFWQKFVDMVAGWLNVKGTLLDDVINDTFDFLESKKTGLAQPANDGTLFAQIPRSFRRLFTASDNLLTKTWTAFAAHQRAFRGADVAGDIKDMNAVIEAYSGAPADRIETVNTISKATGPGPHTRYHIDFGAQGSAYLQVNANGTVFVNAKRLKGGYYAAMMNMAGAWAVNNKGTLIPDPVELSPAAAFRRTDIMLSLALRHGRTDFMVPHEAQGLAFGSDEAQNLQTLAETAYNNIKGVLPEIVDVEHRVGADAGLYWTGDLNRLRKLRTEAGSGDRPGADRRLTADDVGALATIASRRTGKADGAVDAQSGQPTGAGVGVTSIARAVLTQTLMEVGKRGDAAGRPFLDAALRGTLDAGLLAGGLLGGNAQLLYASTDALKQSLKSAKNSKTWQGISKKAVSYKQATSFKQAGNMLAADGKVLWGKTLDVATPLLSSDTRMRRTLEAFPEFKDFADQWHRIPGDGGKAGLLERMQSQSSALMSKWEQVIDSMGRDGDRLAAAVREIQNAGINENAKLSADANKIRKFFDHIHRYVTVSRIPSVGYLKNYWPQVHNKLQIESHLNEFIDFLKDFEVTDPITGNRKKLGEAEAKKLAESIVRPNQNTGASDIPSAGSLKHRVLTDPAYQAEAQTRGWLHSDPNDIIAYYVASLTKQVEFENTFGGTVDGPDGKPKAYNTDSPALRATLALMFGADAVRHNPDEAIKRAEQEGILQYAGEVQDGDNDGARVKQYHLYQRDAKLRNTYMRMHAAKVSPEKVAELQLIIEGYMGTLGSEMNPTLRKAQQAVLAAQVVTTLAFSTVSSIPELGSILALSPSLKSGWNGLVRTAKLIRKPEQRKALLRAMGYATQHIATTAMTDAAGFADQQGTARRVIDAFFTLNGQHLWTRWTRLLALNIGFEAFAEKAAAGDEAFFEELGVNSEQVKAWLQHPTVEGQGGVLPGDNAFERAHPVYTAMHRFVDQRVIRPNAAMKPVIANDPRFALITQLKTFLYAYWHSVSKPLLAATKKRYLAARARGDTTAMAVAQASVPLIVMGAFTIPLAALAMDLKDDLKYELWGETAPTWNDKHGLDRYVELLRRTGVFGPTDMAFGLLDDGGNVADLLGPAAAHLDVGLEHGFFSEKFVRRSTPILGQMPGAWD